MIKITMVLLLTALVLLSSCSSTRKIKTDQGLAEMRKLTLGGAQQWILIRGVDRNLPILLVLHGGPGVSETAVMRKHNAELEQHFVMVYWDQRGACKSYDCHIPPTSMTLEQLTADAHELVGELKTQFHQPKIFLLGHSWGTVLGISLLQQYPQDFYAFVGVSQVVNVIQEEKLSYQFTLEQARTRHINKAIRQLEKIGGPVNGEYASSADLRIQRKWLLRLGGERFDKQNFTDHILTTLFSREYTVFDLFKCLYGIKFSNQHLNETLQAVDFLKNAPVLNVPVVFISGRHDHLTPLATQQAYFDLLQAPDKQLFIFDNSSHSPLFSEAARFNQLMIDWLPRYLR